MTQVLSSRCRPVLHFFGGNQLPVVPASVPHTCVYFWPRSGTSACSRWVFLGGVCRDFGRPQARGLKSWYHAGICALQAAGAADIAQR